jgi:hypothetical protein
MPAILFFVCCLLSAHHLFPLVQASTVYTVVGRFAHEWPADQLVRLHHDWWPGGVNMLVVLDIEQSARGHVHSGLPRDEQPSRKVYLHAAVQQTDGPVSRIAFKVFFLLMIAFFSYF